MKEQGLNATILSESFDVKIVAFKPCSFMDHQRSEQGLNATIFTSKLSDKMSYKLITVGE